MHTSIHHDGALRQALAPQGKRVELPSGAVPRTPSYLSIPSCEATLNSSQMLIGNSMVAERGIGGSLVRPQSVAFTNILGARGAHGAVLPLHSEFLLAETPAGVAFDSYMSSILPDMATCKESSYVYAIMTDQGELAGLSKRPAPCKKPFCQKCKKERQQQLFLRNAPYLDDRVYPRRTIRHVIATSPELASSGLAQGLNNYLEKTKRFHEKLRKSYGYAFNAFVLIEPKYHKDRQSYTIHSHYGILSFVKFAKFRELWLKTWGRNDLVVKFPSWHGKPQFYTKKWAFLEYATRRRVELPLTMPARDFFGHLMHRQLLRRIGFSKSITRIMNTIRKNYTMDRDLPDGWERVYLGKLSKDLDLSHFGERYRESYDLIHAENSDILTSKDIARDAFKRACNPESYEEHIREESARGWCVHNDPVVMARLEAERQGVSLCKN